MIGKLGELALVILFFCFALHFAEQVIQPMFPELVIGSILVLGGVYWYQKRRQW